MLYPYEQLEKNANSIEQQLLVYVLKELKTITKLLENNTPVKTENTTINKNNPGKSIICKQCGLPFDNKGLLLAHIRKEHKKGAK